MHPLLERFDFSQVDIAEEIVFFTESREVWIALDDFSLVGNNNRKVNFDPAKIFGYEIHVL